MVVNAMVVVVPSSRLLGWMDDITLLFAQGIIEILRKVSLLLYVPMITFAKPNHLLRKG
jgi:hypothetical protein